MFGVTSKVCARLWQLMNKEGCNVVHFLWALYFLKAYPTEAVASSFLGGVDVEVMRERIWFHIEAIVDLEADVVSNCLVASWKALSHFSFPLF